MQCNTIINKTNAKVHITTNLVHFKEEEARNERKKKNEKKNRSAIRVAQPLRKPIY